MSDLGMTRAEHLAWAKQRAIEELDASGVVNAVNSMTSDLTKHEETRGIAAEQGTIGVKIALAGGVDAVRRWIEGIT